jgi:hypothetical protein
MIKTNVYELMHKCKVWLSDQGYYTVEKYMDSTTSLIQLIDTDSGEVVYQTDNMPSADGLFSAVNWAIDNKQRICDVSIQQS